ncbi:MAG: LCP family protein [Anaerolineae bacterium]|nr:LCP family protein [Anaerolineae bacterium]
MNKPARNSKAPNLLVSLLAGLLIVVIACAAAIGGYAVTRGLVANLSDTGRFGLQISQGTYTPRLNAEGTPLPPLPGEIPGNDPSLALANLKPWDGAGRVTMLLLGLDYRDWEAQTEAARSDTMILLTLDPQTRTAGILSIPRDLWVAIPGFKHGKINTAYYLGDAYKLPGGGPALAVKTVESFLGIPINYYAQVDFGAFVRFIDEIGGVKIDVPYEITIDLLGKGSQTKKKLKPGVQTLPGEWALAYARNRYTEGGDFDRARRQPQVIMAIRDKIVSVKMLPRLIEKAPTLYSELASGIRTNLSLDDAIKLSLLAKDVPEENIKRGVIDKGDVFFGTSPDGLSILIPIPDDIFTLRDQIFATAGSLGPQTPGNTQERMKSEAARISIYNGSGDASLADRTAEYLRAQGANVVQVGGAAQSYSATTIIDHTGNPYALQYLKDLLGIASGKILIEFDPGAAADIELFLGSDWAAKNSLP